MKPELLSHISEDGSRMFADMPANKDFGELLKHAAKLKDLYLTDYITDQVSEAWIDFRYNDLKFSINAQQGDYFFFANDKTTPESVLEILVDHFAELLCRSSRIAFYGGTFDPVHSGHLAIGKIITELFDLDEFFFMPAYHAPHKSEITPTPSYHRLAMLELAIADDTRLKISTIEIDQRKQRYTYETLTEINKYRPNDIIYFVMGADSWEQITKWKNWETVLTLANHIVVSRPGYELLTDHIPEKIRENVVDVRGSTENEIKKIIRSADPVSKKIYFSDAVLRNVSATKIRLDASDGVVDDLDHLPFEVAKYIEKYELYT